MPIKHLDDYCHMAVCHQSPDQTSQMLKCYLGLLNSADVQISLAEPCQRTPEEEDYWSRMVSLHPLVHPKSERPSSSNDDAT